MAPCGVISSSGLSLFITIIGLIFNADLTLANPSGAMGHLQSQLDELVSTSGGDVQQLAACRISSKDLLATAESTARGVLQGICNPREIENRLHNIESQMADQLNVVKTMLLNIEDKLAQQETQYRRANRKLHGAVAELTESVQSCTTRASNALNNNSPEEPIGVSGTSTNRRTNNSPASAQSTSARNQDGGVADTRWSTGADPDDDEDGFNPRQDEFDRFNNTIHVESGKRVFTYFWKVGDMNYKINSWGPRRSLRSPSFYIFEYGYMMYMRLYPRQNGKNVYTHVGLTKGDYDEALEWPFSLRHRITILDQASPSFQDIISRVWDPKILCSAWNWQRPASGDNHECVGLGLPTEDLKRQNFIRDDNLIIKLTVYLD